MFEKILEIAPEIQLLILINFLLVLVLFILNISNSIKFKSLKKKYKKFMSSGNGNIEQILENCLDGLNSSNTKFKEVDKRIGKVESSLIQCIQKIGIVRYNAFENTGSDMSFSIAILDSKDNGIILSGIYSRDSSATYAKPIIGGVSKYALSAEEQQAIEAARHNFSERQYLEK